MLGCKNKDLRIGWIGYHIEGLLALQALLESGVRVEAVITLKQSLFNNRSGAIDYSNLCKRYKIPLYRVEKINCQESIELLKELSLDVCFVIGWSEIINSEALNTVKVGMIGAHASLLPHNRGSAPINWALINGEEETGNSLIWLAEKVDSGSIINQTLIPISIYDTCSSLYEQVAESNKTMITKVVPKLIDGECVGRPQVELNEPILPRRRPQDGLIDWSKDSLAVYNFIRALTRPYPGAFSWLDGERWIIRQSALLPGKFFADAKPGQVLGPVFSPAETACGQVVACGQGAIVLLELERVTGEILAGRELSDRQWEGKVWTNGTY